MRSNPIILNLGEEFYDRIVPAHFPMAKLRFFNSEWLSKFDLGNRTAKDFLNFHLWLFEPWPQNLPGPLALRYHGHQFRTYNPHLGDGRGFLAAQFSHEKKIYDLGTKGSGKTPYSRGGDGKLTLKGAMREALATELLESYGVNTSRTFCFFETGEDLERNDEPSPTRSAVLTRLSHGHIRFGTFQRLAYLDEIENLEKLTAYCLKYYYDLENFSDQPGSQLLTLVTQKTAELAAQVMLAGFVHGVLNTDNMNISGELFDYGPYRFLSKYDPSFTAAYFDQSGLYSYGRQPESFLWGLERLGLSLQKANPSMDLVEILSRFADLFNTSVRTNFFIRLNLRAQSTELDEKLLSLFFKFLDQENVLFEQTFFDLFGGIDNYRLNHSPQKSDYQKSSFQELKEILSLYQIKDSAKMNHTYLKGEKPETLIIEEIESLWSTIAEGDDWTAFNDKIARIRAFRGLY